MTKLRHKFLVMATSVGMLGAAGLYTVAQAQNTQATTQAQPQQVNVSDSELREFATARTAVEQIQTKYQGLAQDVQSQEQMQQLQKQANEEMVTAVQATSLSVEQYNQIASLIQTDQRMLERYRELNR